MNSQRIFFTVFLFVLSITSWSQTKELRQVQQNKTIRHYLLHQPATFNDSLAERPLVICLHGYGDTISNFQSFIELNAVADTAGFWVAYPQARTNRAWNSGISSHNDYPTGMEDDVAFISLMIDSISKNHAIDAGRIYCCGFSNGGFMTFKLACELSDRICAIGSVGGLMSRGVAEKCRANHSFPLVMIHGTADNVVTKKGGGDWMSLDEVLAFWSPQGDIPQQRIYDYVGKKKTKTGQILVMKGTLGPDPDNSTSVVFEMLNGDHSWPSSYYPCEIHGSSELWKFFKKWEMRDGVVKLR